MASDGAKRRGFDGMLALIVGIFALVIGSNAVMIWLAVGASPDLVTEDYYAKSLNYEQTLQARREAVATGWQVAPLKESATPAQVAFTVRTPEGAPMTGLQGAAQAYRPSDRAYDQLLPLREDPAQPGTYVARFERPAAGKWELTVRLDGNGQHYVRTYPLVLSE